MTIRETLSAALAATPEAHAATLFGERPAGSKWGREFTREGWEQLLPRWKRHEPPAQVRQEGCQYFRAPVGDLFPRATLGAVPWSLVEKLDLYGRVEEAHGPHGAELQMRRSCVGDVLPLSGRASYATLIVGEHEGAQVVFTIHPGEPLSPYSGDHRPCQDGRDDVEWDTAPTTAVKLA
jgi:hypothetical protein